MPSQKSTVFITYYAALPYIYPSFRNSPAPSYNSAPYAFLGTLPLYLSAITNMPACP